MALKTVNEESLVAIGDAIRAKTGLARALEFPGGMIDAVDSIETVVLPEEAYVISGSCYYRFSNDGWNWFINQFGDKISSNNITEAGYMFNKSKLLEEIPFDINLKGQ
jgi:hypothetical protein